MIRPFQLGKINVLGWNVLDGRLVRFAKRQCNTAIGNHTARYGYDNASRIRLDRNRMIQTRKFDLLCFRNKSPPGRSPRNYPAVIPPSTARDAPTM